MNITRPQIRTQYDRAKREGWIAFFRNTFRTPHYDTADGLAIGSRESNLDKKWLTKAGDHGNGFGLMQADKRSFPEWIKTGAWKDAEQGVQKGHEILIQKRQQILDSIGKSCSVKSSKTGKTSKFIGKPISGDDLNRVAIASYNCGGWAYYAYSNGHDCDKFTTGGDYSRDVLERAKVFRELLSKESAVVPVVAQAQPTEQTSESTELQDKQQPTPQTQTVVEEKNETIVSTSTTAGQAADVPPTKVTKNGPLAKWLFSGGGLVTFGTAVWGFATANASTIGIGIICLTALIGFIIFRHAITDAIRMEVAADPNKNNVE